MKVGDIFEVVVEGMAFGGRGVVRVEVQREIRDKRLGDKKQGTSDSCLLTPVFALRASPGRPGSPFVIFVDGGLQGQKVKIRISKKKRRYAEAKVVEVLERAEYEELREEYQQIPGAPWMTVPGERQREWKVEQVRELFGKLGGDNEKLKMKNEKCRNFPMDEVIVSPRGWNYRNKMEYSFGPTEEECIANSQQPPLGGANSFSKPTWIHSGFGLGFKKRGQFHLVEDLRKPSGLFDDDFERAIVKIRDFCEGTGLPVYNQRTHEGFWRHLVVRKSFEEGKVLVCVVVRGESGIENRESGGKREKGKGKEDLDIKQLREGFVGMLLREVGEDRVKGIFWQESESMGDSVRQYETRDLLWGEEVLEETLRVGDRELRFEISMDSFFQTNPASCEKLYAKVIDYVGSAANSQQPTANSPLILDLFCGTGTIGQVVKAQMPEARVMGVELIPEAVEDAKRNAEKNGLEMEFWCGDVGGFLKEYSGKNGKRESPRSAGEKETRNENPEGERPEVVIVDPPRAGIAPKTLQKVIDLGAESIVYVSCNPATMARDTAILQEQGYVLEKLSIVDQFPGTGHVECVGCFNRLSD